MNTKIATRTGWVLSGLLAAFLLFGALNALMGSEQVMEQLKHLGFARSILGPIGMLEVACTILFLVPRTAFIGALLLTAYMGGAVVSHARIGEGKWVVPVVFGVLVWVALWLRDGRLRAAIR